MSSGGGNSRRFRTLVDPGSGIQSSEGDKVGRAYHFRLLADFRSLSLSSPSPLPLRSRSPDY